jgi:hypothetical protein
MLHEWMQASVSAVGLAHITSIFNAPLRVLPIGRDSNIILNQSCVANHLLLALLPNFNKCIIRFFINMEIKIMLIKRD